MKLFAPLVCALVATLLSTASLANDPVSSDFSAGTSPSSATISLPSTGDNSSKPARSFSASAPRLSQADAANVVREHIGGQVMAVTPKVSGGKTHYAVKVLSEGRMRTIHVDGDTGSIR